MKTASLIGMAPTVPSFLARMSQAALANPRFTDPDQRILVVIQLDGGNDGVNTVIPFADEGYAKNRQQLRLPTDNLFKLSDSVGLHASMQSWGEIWDAGQLAVLQGVSYPNPSLSHDVSMSVWHTAQPDEREVLDYGWLGRALDSQKTTSGSDAVFTERRAKPLALVGRKCVVDSLTDTDDLRLRDDAASAAAAVDAEDLQQFMTRSTLEAYTASRRLEGIAKDNSQASTYPSSYQLADRLQTIAGLIKSGWSSRVYYAVQGGYDTHSGQLFQHSRLLRELSTSVVAFQKDLNESGLQDRVVTMCFSEFGRRVKENGSAGTDHGTAGPMFVLGGPVQGGLFGKMPPLTELDNDNLKPTVDFRNAYATLIDRWLGSDSANVLGKEFSPLEFLPTS